MPRSSKADASKRPLSGGFSRVTCAAASVSRGQSMRGAFGAEAQPANQTASNTHAARHLIHRGQYM